MLKGDIKNKRINKVIESDMENKVFEINDQMIIPEIEQFKRKSKMPKIVITRYGSWEIKSIGKREERKLESIYRYLTSRKFKVLMYPYKKDERSKYEIDTFISMLKENEIKCKYYSKYVYDKNDIEMNFKIHKDLFIIAYALMEI